MNRTTNSDGVEQKKERSSNLEIFRIISIILIIAHHYIVNSNLINEVHASPLAINSILAMIIGAWGKTGINCFIMITGYFMCKSNITLKKYVKLVAEVVFYKVVIYFIFLITGKHTFSFVNMLLETLPVTDVKNNFTGCFLLFYLFIPFLNCLIKGMTEKQHIKLLCLICFIYVVLGSVPKITVTMNYVSWYTALYLIASYVSMYPKKAFDNTKLWGILSIVFIALSITSILVFAWASAKVNQFIAFILVGESNRPFALATGVSLFMFFKNIKLKNSKIINTVASTTFGVLLIHANSYTMREWLWNQTLKNSEYFYSEWFVLHAIVSVISVFVICSALDLIRIKCIENPCIKLWNKIEVKFVEKYTNIENKVCSKMQIGGTK